MARSNDSTIDTTNQGYQLRSVASVNGTSFYEGASTGVYYTTLGSDGAPVALSTAPTARNVEIAPTPAGGEQLYVSSDSAGFVGVSTVGTGLPTTAGQTVTLLSSTMPAEQAGEFGTYDFKFAEMSQSDGFTVDTLFIVNDNTDGMSPEGIQQWSYTSADGWSYTDTNLAGMTSTEEGAALGISVAGGVPTLYIIDNTQFGATTGGNLVYVIDTAGYNTAGFAGDAVHSTSASASSNTNWHGEADAPVSTQTNVSSNVATGSLTGADATITFTATVTSTNASPAPSQPFPGTVQFYDGLVPIGSPQTLSTSGTAQITVSTSATQQSGLYITPGIDTITAVYSGDFDGDFNSLSGYAGSSGTVNQVVQAQAFGFGDQFVYRVGDGTNNATGSNGSAVFVDEYNSSGVLQQSIAMPTADAAGSDSSYYNALVALGSEQTAGQLNLSGNGQYVFLDGYDEAPTSTTTPATDNALRTIARIDSNGFVTTETINNASVTTGSFPSYIASVYSPDGNQVYIGGYEAFGIDYLSSWTPGQTVAATSIVSLNGELDLRQRRQPASVQ